MKANAFLGLLVYLAACGDSETTVPDGKSGTPGFVTDAGGPSNGAGCVASAKLMLMLGSDETFYSFDPAGLAVQKLAKLACPVEAVEHPTNLAVDRSGKAWVVFERGGTNPAGMSRLFTVDPATGSCQATNFRERADVLAANGAFVTNSAGSTSETLYFKLSYQGRAGGYLAKLNSSFALEEVAQLRMPDGTDPLPARLTGTGQGKLFGLFSVYTRDPSNIAEIALGTGAIGGATAVPADPTSAAEGENWTTFATWGGDFYLFKSGTGFTSQALRYRATDRSFSEVAATFPFIAIGASSSTCAPTAVN